MCTFDGVRKIPDVCNNAFKEEFLFCYALETTTKAADILNCSQLRAWNRKILLAVALMVRQQCWDTYRLSSFSKEASTKKSKGVTACCIGKP